MQNILIALSLCLLQFLGCWFVLGQDGLDPDGLVQAYLGVSPAATPWFVLGVYSLAGAWTYRTAL